VPISNELFVFDLQAHSDSGRLIGKREEIRLLPDAPSSARNIFTRGKDEQGAGLKGFYYFPVEWVESA